jgi:hypothetical protein
MGIKDFTKVFEPVRELTYKNLAGKAVAIDGNIEIHRAAHGVSGKTAQFTDKAGIPSLHINTILLGTILKLKAVGATQYWVFDYESIEEPCHNPLKELELQKRKEKKVVAKAKLDKLNAELKSMTVKTYSDNEEFSDDDETERPGDDESLSQDKIDKIKQEIDKQERVAFSLEEFYKEDVIFMLNVLDIPWIVCPPGFEAEQIAAIATYKKIFDKKMDYVFTPDSDALLFGARRLIKRNLRKKKIFEYDLASLLKDNDLKQEDLIKIGLILGADFAPKTPGIGPKTVLDKYKKVELSNEQIAARDTVFMREISTPEINSIVIHNEDTDAFSNKNKYIQLLDWLELVKGYNRERIDKQFKKANLFV